MATEDPDNYKVGYGKPPKHSQFAKGKSGNPSGHRKGVKNFVTEIQEELNVRIPITENGKRKKITKRKAVAKQLVNKAAAGDPKAIPILLNETRPYETDLDDGLAQPESMSQEDQAVIESIAKRIREAASERDSTKSSQPPAEEPSHTTPRDEHENPR